MIEYPKIQTMFKRNMEGDKKIVVGDWARPELQYLQDADWTFTEKVDGTNIRVEWDGENVVYGGRTDSAQIPNGVINRLNDLFYSTPARARLREVFPEGHVLLFGEGYGAKIQKGGGNYSSAQDFVLFDVLVGDMWLERGNVRAIGLTLEAIRSMERYGTSQMMDAALSGFAALPAGATVVAEDPPKPWHEVLGVSPNASPELIKAAYKVAIQKAHPDTGGDIKAFSEVQRAYEEATQ